MSSWQPTDILRPLRIQVRRISKMGVGSAAKGTQDGVIYWMVLTSAHYANRTGVHIISMVPETQLRPLCKVDA